jgi:hypothetical protein
MNRLIVLHTDEKYIQKKVKWPSYEECNLEARMKSAIAEEQNMTFETRKDTECIE